MFHSGIFLVPSAQLLFVSWVWGAPFSSEMSCFFFLSDFFLWALCLSGFVCLPAVAYCGCWNWSPLCWERRAVKFSPFKAWSRSKYSYACFSDCQEGFHSFGKLVNGLGRQILSDRTSDNICLPSPFTGFPKLFHLTFSKNVVQWQIMKSRLQAWSKHYRLIAYVHQPFTHSLFGCG